MSIYPIIPEQKTAYKKAMQTWEWTWTSSPEITDFCVSSEDDNIIAIHFDLPFERLTFALTHREVDHLIDRLSKTKEFQEGTP